MPSIMTVASSGVMGMARSLMREMRIVTVAPTFLTIWKSAFTSFSESGWWSYACTVTFPFSVTFARSPMRVLSRVSTRISISTEL